MTDLYLVKIERHIDGDMSKREQVGGFTIHGEAFDRFAMRADNREDIARFIGMELIQTVKGDLE